MGTLNRLRIRALALVLAAAVSAWAPIAVAELAPGGDGTVRSVTDGDTVTLADGREVRLVGIQAPKLPLGRTGFRKWPLADEAKAALEALVAGKTVTLAYGGQRTDRHGRALAHLYLPDRRWVQGAMLDQGMARVYSFADNRALVAEMLARERAARAARRGIWADPFYRVLGDRDAGRHVGTFQLVEGRVLKVAIVRGRTYLNFDRDYRRDFTITVPAGARRLFPEAGRALRDLEGKRVRVRGWLRYQGGPMIVATHPEQIEVLER